MIENCLMCNGSGATGQWQLCPACRTELARRSSERQERMAPDHCLGCDAMKRGKPIAGSVYCPKCTFRFGGKSKS